MSQVTTLFEDSSDDIEERPIASSVPPLPISRKRPWDEDVGSEDSQVADHRESHEGIAAAASQPMNSDSEQISRNDRSAKKRSKKRSTSKPPSNASGRQGRVSSWKNRLSELADYRKTHGDCNVAVNYSENLKLAKWVANQRTFYRLHREGKKSRLTLSRIQELHSMGFDFSTVWEDRLRELADYHEIQGHCNVPDSYCGKSKLAHWVAIQRTNYRLHLEGKESCLTISRIQELESLDFEWDRSWEDRFSELADYRKIHGHCNVPQSYSENSKLSEWVKTQRSDYELVAQGESTPTTPSRIRKLESLDFEWDWDCYWEDRLSELADYRRIHGNCNVPQIYSENSKLSEWVTTQRSDYELVAQGKSTPMTTSRIRKLESLDFEWDWDCSWEDRLSELADYREAHGHCNVPQSYSENSKLSGWVHTQRRQHKLHLEKKTSRITLSRIQELESLGFEWKPRNSRNKGNVKNPGHNDDTTRVRERTVETPEHVQTTSHAQEDVNATAWEVRLSELADYRKIHGHCNVPDKYSENTMLANWVKNQRTQYRLQKDGKSSHMTLSRIQALERLGFEWHIIVAAAAWEDHLRELADYRKIHGHCNVPQNYSENTELANWVAAQRSIYRWHLKGKTSPMTLSRMQELESLGFEWHIKGAAAAWVDRLSELDDYRKIHGHCNVPRNYSESTKLGVWVGHQRTQYLLHLKGKASCMTFSRIQELESIGFEWHINGAAAAWEDRLSELLGRPFE